MASGESRLDRVFITRIEEPAAGTRLAVKDILDTAGIRTTYGSPIFSDHVPDRTAEVVLRLEGAGYANVGKANLHEFAFGMTSENPHFGTVPNPLAPGRVAFPSRWRRAGPRQRSGTCGRVPTRGAGAAGTPSWRGPG